MFLREYSRIRIRDLDNNKKKLVVAAILAFVFEVGIVNAVKAEEITLPSPSLNNLPASVTYTRGSIYEYVDGSSSDYDIKFFNGTDTIYKNIQLVSSKIASGTLSLTPTDTQPSYDWTNGKYSGSDVTIEGNTVSGAIRIRASHNDSLPTDWTKYYTYQYTKPTGYEFEGTRINNTIANDGANVQNKIFSNISNNSSGAVIYNNNKDLSSVDIISDFVGNKTSGMGSAIYNLANNGENNSKINSIKGNFIGNNSGSTSADAFGAIGNRTTVKGNAYIGTIEGDFVGNSTKVGAAIRNYSSRNDSGIAEIGSIKGNFIGNYSSDWGGAIANTGKITNIIGDFINNNSLKGGAIDNSRYMDNDELFIENIYGDFISNTSTTAGGAITNNAGIIKNINSNFIGNHSKKGGAICNYNDKSYGVAQITKIAGDFVSNISEEAGGAIYNDSAQK